MAFIDWLKKQHSDSLKASQRMAADPYLRGMKTGANVAPAPEGAIPFQRTNPGFFARDYKKEDLVDNTLTVKNDGTQTLVKKWKNPDLRISGLGEQSVMPRGIPIPPPSNQRNPFDMPVAALLPRGRLSPEAQAAIAQVQATGGQNVDAYGDPVGVDVSNQRAMYQASRKPVFQKILPTTPSPFGLSTQTQRNIWGSRFVPNPAPMIRKERNAPPVGTDADEWRWILDRIYGGNY